MKRFVGQEVNAPLHSILQLILQMGQIQKAPPALKFHQQIHVAFISHLSSDYGPKKGGPLYAILAQYIDYLFPQGLYLLARGHPLWRQWDSRHFILSRGQLVFSRIKLAHLPILARGAPLPFAGSPHIPVRQVFRGRDPLVRLRQTACVWIAQHLGLGLDVGTILAGWNLIFILYF